MSIHYTSLNWPIISRRYFDLSIELIYFVHGTEGFSQKQIDEFFNMLDGMPLTGELA